ncbi:MAG: hypothetical protein WCX69_03300 [Candidatus Paceibacterota bacterium]
MVYSSKGGILTEEKVIRFFLFAIALLAICEVVHSDDSEEIEFDFFKDGDIAIHDNNTTVIVTMCDGLWVYHNQTGNTVFCPEIDVPGFSIDVIGMKPFWCNGRLVTQAVVNNELGYLEGISAYSSGLCLVYATEVIVVEARSDRMYVYMLDGGRINATFTTIYGNQESAKVEELAPRNI